MNGLRLAALVYSEKSLVSVRVCKLSGGSVSACMYCDITHIGLHLPFS